MFSSLESFSEPEVKRSGRGGRPRRGGGSGSAGNPISAVERRRWKIPSERPRGSQVCEGGTGRSLGNGG